MWSDGPYAAQDDQADTKAHAQADAITDRQPEADGDRNAAADRHRHHASVDPASVGAGPSGIPSASPTAAPSLTASPRPTATPTPTPVLTTPAPALLNLVGTDPVRHLLRRTKFGPTPDLVAEVRAKGTSARLEEQLARETIDDSACESYDAINWRLDVLTTLIFDAPQWIQR